MIDGGKRRSDNVSLIAAAGCFRMRRRLSGAHGRTCGALHREDLISSKFLHPACSMPRTLRCIMCHEGSPHSENA